MTHQQTILVAHPTTGQIVDVGQQPPEVLADVLQAINDRLDEAKRLKAMGDQLEQELRRRLELRGRRAQTFGDWEVQIVKPPNEAQWDADEVEEILWTYVEAGVLDASELTEVIKRTATVNRTEINKIIGRLTGPQLEELKSYRRWKPNGRTRVRVTRSVQLVEPAQDPEPAPAHTISAGPQVAKHDPDRGRYWGD